MKIQDIQKLYAMLPQAGAIQKIQKDKSIRTVFLQGLVASAAPMFFASIAERWKTTTVFVLNDNDEAGYFYNDLKTIAMPVDGEGKVARAESRVNTSVRRISLPASRCPYFTARR